MQLATEGLDPVGQSTQPGAARVGAPGAVVGHDHHDVAAVVGDADRRRPGARVPRDVGESLGADVVGRRGHLVR